MLVSVATCREGSVFLSNSTKLLFQNSKYPRTSILLDEYDVDAPRLESDLLTLLTQLADKDLVGGCAVQRTQSGLQ